MLNYNQINTTMEAESKAALQFMDSLVTGYKAVKLDV